MTSLLDRFFLDKKIRIKESLGLFKDLPGHLIPLIGAEKDSLYLTPGTRLVKDQDGVVIAGYWQHYSGLPDIYHPQEWAPFYLKGYWIPQEEGHLFIASSEETCPLIRETPQGKEVLFLIHPKSEHLFKELIKKYETQEIQVPALALSSYRTLLIGLPPMSDYAFVKVSLDEEIGGVLRILSVKECACSVGMTVAINHQKPAALSFFNDEMAFVSHVTDSPQGAGMIYRKIPDDIGEDEYLIPFFSLFGHSNRELLSLLIKESQKSPTDFVTNYLLGPLADLFTDLIYNEHISIEAHGQNLLLAITTKGPLKIRFFYRDMGGVNVLLSEKNFNCLPPNLRHKDYYYLDTHVQDTARALEQFVTTIVFNLTKQFFKTDDYEKQDSTFAEWKRVMIERGFSGNWSLDDPTSNAHQETFSPENFYRYGYFEKIFGKLLLDSLLQRGILKTLVGNQELEAYSYLADKLSHPDNPYNNCLDIEWFNRLILQTYPEFIDLKKNSLESLIKEALIHPRPFSTPSADLFQAPIENLSLNLHSPDSLSLIAKDTFLFAMHSQVQNNLKHLNLHFEVTHPEYMHGPVFSGPYPFKPTLNALKSAQDFLDILLEKELPALLICESLEEIEEKLKALQQKHLSFIKQLIRNPLEFYQKFKYRIESQGANAAMPEFCDVILFLELSIKKIALFGCANLTMCHKTLTELRDLTARNYPYRDTLDIIEYCLGFLDAFIRGTAEINTLPTLFHSHQYQYYSSYLKEELPKHLIIPTFYNLGATDLLKVRGVPIGFLGVNVECVWVDGFLQTPLEFWYHDINHTRRMWQFFKEEAIRQRLSIDEFAQKSHRYVTEHLVPLITPLPSDTYDRVNQKRMIKIIFFEILHEDAFAADPHIIRAALIAPPGSLSAVESIKGNKVAYTMEKSGAKLAIVHWKLVANFYDTIETRNEAIVAQDHRSKAHVVDAALFIAEKLNLPDVIESKIWEHLN